MWYTVRVLAVCLALLLGSATARTRGRKHRDTRVFPPSKSALVAQNEEIDRLGLERYKDDRALSAAIEREDLVPIIETQALRISRGLPKNRRYVRPWTAQFLQDISTAYFEAFDKPLQVNSAVRTVKVQRSLRHWNRNAAPIHGDTASSHLAGLTVDLARRGLSEVQTVWLEWYLKGLGDQVIVEEEIHQPCFHMCVRGNYKGAL